MSRFHLASLAIKYSPIAEDRMMALRAQLAERVDAAVRYSRECFEDAPEIREWTWTD
jgi:phosphoketolase